MPTSHTPRVAILIPCYNEAATIHDVVTSFQQHLSGAKIYVFDNNSTDDTSSIALNAGATVRSVTYQGKGNVIRRMFADVEADVYVLVDGDGTYDAQDAPRMVDRLMQDGLDMVVGARVSDEQAAYRTGHRLGNIMLTQFAAMIFGRAFTDMLSGYRVFSRRYVKSFPAHSVAFETETELAVHALQLKMPVAEIETQYFSRPEGSPSKLNTYRDGSRILLTILKLFKAEKPLLFFTLGFGLCMVAALILASPLLVTYLQTGLVPRLPTALLCSALVLVGTIFLACGIILDTVTRGRIEIKHCAYLSVPAVTTQQS